MKHSPTTLIVALALLAANALAADVAPVPPGAAGAKERLEKSPRHGEWVEIAVPNSQVKVKSFVVYPERKEKAPVVIVIQEIFGLTDWIRSVADQLAADGFIAIAPDLLSGKGKDGGGTETFSGEDVRKAVSALKADDVNAMLDAVREYGLKLPAANGKSATIGFCWGGMSSFRYATHQPGLNAAVVYYGANPAPEALEKVKAPVLGLYADKDERVNATIKPAEDKMKELNKPYTHKRFDGAGHGFLRQQENNEANKKAAADAWPETVKFLRENTK